MEGLHEGEKASGGGEDEAGMRLLQNQIGARDQDLAGRGNHSEGSTGKARQKGSGQARKREGGREQEETRTQRRKPWSGNARGGAEREALGDGAARLGRARGAAAANEMQRCTSRTEASDGDSAGTELGASAPTRAGTGTEPGTGIGQGGLSLECLGQKPQSRFLHSFRKSCLATRSNKVEAPIPEGVPFPDLTICTIPIYSLHNSCQNPYKFSPMLL